MSSHQNVNLYFHGINFNIWSLFFSKRICLFNSMKIVSFLLTIIATLSFSLISVDGTGQIYEETFGVANDCLGQGTLANGFNPGEGAWSVTNAAGQNGPLANRWFISNSTLGGGMVGNCTQNCFFGGGQRTLHIGNNSGAVDQGAEYDEPGLNITSTSSRAESPNIDCSGFFNNSVTVRFAHNSFNTIDKASLLYYDGSDWVNLQDLPSTGLCGAGPEMIWDEITIPLPASANDNPTVRIGFNWVNDDTEIGAGLRASVAIDFVRVDAGTPPDPPAPAFIAENNETEICEQSCLNFFSQTVYSEFSSGASNATFLWEFEGGTPATSDVENPTNICFNEPGLYNVSLTVTDNIGTGGPLTLTDYISVLDCAPVIMVDVNNSTPCAGEECINFSSVNSEGNIDPSTWTWTFESEDGSDTFTSNQANPTNICLNNIGFYDLTVSVADFAGLTDTLELPDFIEVLDCFGPEVDFSVSQEVICVGACIQFTDESTSNTPITEWNWTLPGGQAVGEEEFGVSTQQNPEVCYDVAGSYWAVLSATDGQGPSVINDSILITVDPCTGPPEAAIGASDTLICAGDCIDFQNQSLGFQVDYTWIFAGINEVSNEENPQVICYPEAGTYSVKLVVENGVDIPSEDEIFITVSDTCLSPPVPRLSVSQDTICAGKCVNFTDESTGLGSEFFEHEWIFAGAVEGSQTSTAENPAQICYNNPGSYDVVLKVIRPSIPDSATQVFADVVTVVNTPECRPTIIPNIPDTICAGDCAIFSADFIDADSVRWTFTEGTPETSTAFEPGLVCFSDIGEYLVVIQAYNESGEAPPVFQTVFVGERPPLNAGPDLTINAGAVVELTAGLGGQEPNGTFLWQPFELVDDFRSQTVQVSPDESTAFIVYYDQDSSCTAIDTVNVTVNFIQAIGVPNSFSPNGDGRNDVLRVLGQGITRMEFKIFNRYGQLVFETTNQSEGWDGTFNDKELNAGVFVYTLEVTFAEGNREVYTGDITLVR
jgi:gliding motility-associated-like protein